MAGGRPRTVSLEPEEMIDLGQQMCDWVAKNKPMHLSQWYSFEMDITDKDWNSMRQCPEFLHYYTKALKMVGMQYLDKDSKVDVRIKDRWQRVYFKDLKQEEDETKKHDAQLKAQAETEAAGAYLSQHAEAMEYLQKMRTPKAISAEPQNPSA